MKILKVNDSQYVLFEQTVGGRTSEGTVVSKRVIVEEELPVLAMTLASRTGLALEVKEILMELIEEFNSLDNGQVFMPLITETN